MGSVTGDSGLVWWTLLPPQPRKVIAAEYFWHVQRNIPRDSWAVPWIYRAVRNFASSVKRWHPKRFEYESISNLWRTRVHSEKFESNFDTLCLKFLGVFANFDRLRNRFPSLYFISVTLELWIFYVGDYLFQSYRDEILAAGLRIFMHLWETRRYRNTPEFT